MSKRQELRQRTRNYVQRAMQGRKGYGRGPLEVAGGSREQAINSITNTNLTAHAEQYNHNRGYVYAIIRTIAQRIAGQKIVVGRVNGSHQKKSIALHKSITERQPISLKNGLDANDYTILKAHPLIDVLKRPNAIMVGYTLIYVTVQSLDITGKAYWWMQRGDKTKSGKPEIWPLPASWVEPIHKDGLFSAWRIRPYGGMDHYDVPGNEIAYFYYPDPSDPMSALAPMMAQARTVTADEYLELAQTRSYQNGINIGMALTVGRLPETAGIAGDTRPVLTASQRNELINAVKAQYRGVMNQDEPLILDGLITDAKKITNNPREMDYLNSSNNTKSRMAQGWGVNPISMGQVEGANRASSAVADDHLCANVANPRIEFICQTMSYHVAPFFAQPGEELVAYLERATSHDDEHDLNVEVQMVDHGAYGINEWRRKRGMPPIRFADGRDRILVNGILIPVDIEVDEGRTADPYDSDHDGIKTVRHWSTLRQDGCKSFAEVIGVKGMAKLWEQQQRKYETALAEDLAGFFVRLGCDLNRKMMVCVQESSPVSSLLIDTVMHESEVLPGLKDAIRERLYEIALGGAALEWQLQQPKKSFQMPRKGIVDWIQTLPTKIRDNVADYAKRLMERPFWANIVNTIKDKIRDALGQQREDGNAGIAAVENAIENVLGVQAAEDHAANIAVTESVTAMNGGQNEVVMIYNQAGATQKRQWWTQQDSKVRPDHKAAHGQIRGALEPFLIGGEQCMYPGDPILTPKQRCNCRCTVINLVQ